MNQLVAWYPEFELPPIGDDDRRMLIEQICLGATSYKEIKERQVWPVVKSWLSPAQQELMEKYAPERIELPNGRKAKITYDAKSAPTIATRIRISTA
ncbi:MAG: ATP-dependent helicase C-terminal domain-containing protein [Chthoniobacter sp.]